MDSTADLCHARFRNRSAKRRRNHITIGSLFVLTTAITHGVGMATSAAPSESIPLLRSQLRGGGRVAIRDALDETKTKTKTNRVRTTQQQQQIRRLSFLEKGNLFEDHKNNKYSNESGCSCEQDSPHCECSETSGEDSEDSGIGMGIVGATDIDKTAGGGETTANPAPGKDSQSHTIQSHPQQQHNNQHNHNNNQSSETNSDGGDAATPTTNDAEKYVDGLEVDRPDNSANTNTIVSSETEKSYDPEPEDGDPIFLFEDETHDDENEENDDETNSIPKKDIAIFTGLAAASLLLYAIYWRDNVLHERIEAVQKHQARIDRLKNLYDDNGLDKYSAHVLDGCSKGDVMGVPCVSKSRRSKLSRTRSNMPVDLDLGTIEPEDNTTTTTNHHSSDDDDDDDNEDASSSSSASSFGRERLPDDESLSRDDVIEPVLTVRRVRRTSGTNEHWIKYSSDEFEAMSSSLSSSDTESGESQSGSSTHNGSNNSNEDSIPQLS